jgi:very-short-patch-repair endonuclease
VDVVEHVRGRGGIARRSTLPRRPIEAALREGRLLAPRQGLVAVPDLPEPVLQALRLGGVVSCGSAAQVLGLQLINQPSQLHVTVPRNLAVASQPGVVLHRRDVPQLEVTTTLARTAIDCARCFPPLEALVVLDQVLARGVPRADLLALLSGRGSSAARQLVLLATGLSGSTGETAARWACVQAGLSVQSQVHIPGVGWVDLVVEGCVIVEIDGLAYHSDGQQFATDRRRDAAAQIQGYRVLRFTWRDAIRRPEYVVETVQALLSTMSRADIYTLSSRRPR